MVQDGHATMNIENASLFHDCKYAFQFAITLPSTFFPKSSSRHYHQRALQSCLLADGVHRCHSSLLPYQALHYPRPARSFRRIFPIRPSLRHITMAAIPVLSVLLVADTDTSLGRHPLRPIASNLDIGIWGLPVGYEQPETKHHLDQNVQHGIGDNLSVHRRPVSATRNPPNTTSC